MKFWAKIGLFLSSYFPFFLILTIKNFPNFKLEMVFMLITGFSMLVWGFIFRDSREEGEGDQYKILKIENKTHESLSYIAPYLIAFLSFNLNKWQDVTVLVLFLMIIFVVFINSDLLYVNPLLSCFNHQIYRVEVCNPFMPCEATKREILLITRENKLKKGDKISLKEIDDGVLWR